MSIISSSSHGLSTLSPTEQTFLRSIITEEMISQLYSSGATVKDVQEIFEEVFTEKYGALADSEREDLSIPEFYNEITNALWLNEKLKYIPWERPLNFQSLIHSDVILIHIDCPEIAHQDSPAVKLYNDPYCSPAGCKPIYHQLLCKHMQQLFKQQEDVYREFLTKPLKHHYPMQDLRNRCCRVMTMEKQRTIYSVWAAHHLLQRNAIMKQQQAKYTLMGPVGKIELPNDDFVKYNNFITEKRHVFTTRSIRYHGKVEWIQVVGEFPPQMMKGKAALEEDFNINTVISIRNYITKRCLGSISFHKTWSSFNDSTESHISFLDKLNEKTYQSPDKIVPYCITAHSIHTESNERESDGDLPIYRLLAQIAIEVLLREDFNLLEIKSTSNLGGVFFNAGFYGERFDSSTEFTIARLREHGVLFSQPQGLMPHILTIEKNQSGVSMELSHPHTRLVSKDFFGQHPTRVSFDLGSTSSTWEEIIASGAGPLLGGRQTESVLPTYNFKNLTLS